MSWEPAFKGLCSNASKGVSRTALFIVPDSNTRKAVQLTMLDEASARGLTPLFFASSRLITLSDNVRLYLRVAHPHLDRELTGIRFDFIHGLGYFDELENGVNIAAILARQVRPDDVS